AGDNGYDPRPYLFEVAIGVRAELVGVGGLDGLGHVVDLAVPDGHSIVAADPFASQFLDLALGVLELAAQRLYALGQLLGGGVEGASDVRQQVAIAPDEVVGGLAHHHVDAPQAGADARLGDDHRWADVGGVLDVGAAAQLARPVTEANHPHHVAVLLFEKVHRALRDGLFVWLVALVEREAFADLDLDAPVDVVDLFFCDRAVERDVERRVVRTDPRALLHDVLAERLAQRLVQQVGRGVVAHDLAAPFLVDGRGRLLTRNQLAGDDDAQVRYRSLRWLLRVLDSDETARRLDGPCIADLAARLGI